MKPIINKITPFDASIGGLITMYYNGELPYKNRIVIYNADTLESVYDRTITNYNLEHAIPANTLKNGIKYAVQGQVFDSQGNASELSDKGYFWTFTTPLFYFSNIHNDDVINKASFFVNLNYTQNEYEKISEYRFYLYDDAKNILLESETYYNSNNFNYAFKALNDDRIYYVRARGITVNGFELDTGYIKVFVNYENPKEYKYIFAKCNDNNSIVTYQTNFVVINASGNEQYEYEDSFIDLIEKTLVYDEGFIVSGDFTMTIRMKMYGANSTLLKCSNSTCGFTITTPMDDKKYVRFKLTAPNGICNYILYSEPILYNVLDIVTLHIRRINNIYQLFCFVENKDSLRYTTWFGQQDPVTASGLTEYDVWIDNTNDGVVRIDKDHVNVFLQNYEPALLAEHQYDMWIGGE